MLVEYVPVVLVESIGVVCGDIGMTTWEGEPLSSGLHAGIVFFATPSGRGGVRSMAFPMLLNAMRSQ